MNSFQNIYVLQPEDSKRLTDVLVRYINKIGDSLDLSYQGSLRFKIEQCIDRHIPNAIKEALSRK
ncbi:MAG: hypothetical protein AABY22_05925 [Nanoarchaeota archaeon]